MVEKKGKEQKDTFEKKIDEAKDSVSDVAEKVGEGSKKLIGKISKRWDKSSTGEKVCMIVGIVLLLIGLIILWDIVAGLIFILLGIALVSGFFVKKDK